MLKAGIKPAFTLKVLFYHIGKIVFADYINPQRLGLCKLAAGFLACYHK